MTCHCGVGQLDGMTLQPWHLGMTTPKGYFWCWPVAPISNWAVKDMHMATETPEEIALRCIDVGWKAVHLKKLDDGGGCEGCVAGWCQMAVDAAADARGQFADAIRKEFGLPIVEAEE